MGQKTDLIPALLLLACSLLLALPAAARQEPVTVRGLWESAAAAVAREEWPIAAGHYERLHREFGQSEFAEEALWQAAQLRKKIAEEAEDPNWERVRDLFRRYSTDYPDSPRRDQAYLEVGISHLRMRFLREALTYFRLFEQRYPDSPLLSRARYWRARTLVETAAFADAVDLYRALINDHDPDVAFDALAALGRVRAVTGDHLEAVDTFHELLRRYPLTRFSHPEVLLDLGRSYLVIGREEEGRELLFAFINLDPASSRRLEALFALAESRHRQGDPVAADRLYNQILQEGAATAREVVMAAFRRAEARDAVARREPGVAHRRGPADPVGDQEYRAVIDRFPADPLAQEARYGLYRRLLQREELNEAVDVAQSYVRHAPTPGEPGADSERTGGLLFFLLSRLLEQGDYQRIYQVYINEHRHIVSYEPGRLRFLIGRALEELALYEQAAVVYYRALAGPLDDQELARLYYRRALVYFALNDLAAAERLLAHLRRIYAEQPEQLAEVFALSGRLREQQQRYEEGWEFFQRALEYPAESAAWGEHLPALLRTGEALTRFGELLSPLERAWREEWLAPELLQSWYRRVGDGLRRQGNRDEARRAYTAGLGEGMPTGGEDFQAASLQLGSLLAADQEADEAAVAHLEAATAGPDPLLGKVARQRLNQLAIDRAKGKMQSLFD